MHSVHSRLTVKSATGACRFRGGGAAEEVNVSGRLSSQSKQSTAGPCAGPQTDVIGRPTSSLQATARAWVTLPGEDPIASQNCYFCCGRMLWCTGLDRMACEAKFAKNMSKTHSLKWPHETAEDGRSPPFSIRWNTKVHSGYSSADPRPFRGKALTEPGARGSGRGRSKGGATTKL